MNLSRSRIAPLAVGLATVTLVVAGCGVDIDISSGDDDGPTVVESFEIDEFEQLAVGDTWTVFVTVGPEPSLEVEVAEDLLDEVQIEQDGDRLTLSMDGPRWFSSHRGRREATITTPSLTELEVDGAVNVELSGLTVDQLDVDVEGASEVDLGEIAVQRLTIGLEGASSIAGEGTAEVVTIDAEGASSVDFGQLVIDQAEIDVSGASSVDLEGAEAVSGRLAGASSVDVDDDASVSVRTEGASSVD